MIYIEDGIRKFKATKFEAVQNLVDTREISAIDDELSYHDETTPPTEEAILTERDRLDAEWLAQEYARNRQLDYPNIGDQMDMMYKDNKNSTTTHADAVEAVKTKWPKDNSGPVE